MMIGSRMAWTLPIGMRLSSNGRAARIARLPRYLPAMLRKAGRGLSGQVERWAVARPATLQRNRFQPRNRNRLTQKQERGD